MQKEDILRSYESALCKEELSSSTRQIYIRAASRFLNYMGQATIDKCQVLAYKEFLEARNYAVSTLNLKIAAVNRFLRYCGLEEYCMKSQRIQKRKSLEYILTGSEYQTILAYTLQTGRYKYYALFKTLALTGIRISELKYVTVESLEAGYTNVKNKGKVREIHLSDGLVRILKNYCEKECICSGCVFRGNKGKPISRVAVWKMLQHMAEKLGMDERKAHPHNFRHYFALAYMQEYSNLFELADLLGHSSLETTRLYTMSTIEDKRRRLESLDDKIS